MREAAIIGDTDGRGDAARFLDRLAAPGGRIDDPVAVLAAHPDDETIWIGGQLSRLTGAVVVHVTDGAPRDMTDARRSGFATREGYAAGRRKELETAMALAGLPPSRLRLLGVVDQEAALHLADLSRRLADLLEDLGASILLTHPYEGGHPDHDATCFVAHAAAGLIARRGERHPAMIEAPSYHEGPDGRTHQRFIPVPDRTELVLRLGGDQRALKQRMLDAHLSQRWLLASFATDEERFRRAPRYDFAALPNGGRLLYERYEWGMTGKRWLALAAEAQRELAKDMS